MLELAAAAVEPETWGKWFGAVSERMRKELADTWGKAPGELMVREGKLLIPGIINGNIFIGLQPSRALGERALELYYSTDSTPPYSYDPDRVKDDPTADYDGISGQTVYDGAVAAARRLTAALAERNYEPSALADVVAAERFPGPTADLERVLRYMCEVVKDKLDHISDEMDHLIGGTNGRFVPPALGGNPTRGNVSILPTGRNFYASDPAQIPSRAAWEIGGKLARQMLDQYGRQEGGWPESVAMVVWAGNTTKTCGEDFAECLHLMGMRPVYLGETTQVLEPV